MKYVAALALCLLSGSASAHDWYPYECCHGDDCAKIPVSRVKEKNGGFEVTVYPHDHKQAKDWDGPVTFHFTYKMTRGSEDQNYHICILPSKVALCFFAPIGGA